MYSNFKRCWFCVFVCVWFFFVGYCIFVLSQNVNYNILESLWLYPIIIKYLLYSTFYYLLKCYGCVVNFVRTFNLMWFLRIWIILTDTQRERVFFFYCCCKLFNLHTNTNFHLWERIYFHVMWTYIFMIHYFYFYEIP